MYDGAHKRLQKLDSFDANLVPQSQVFALWNQVCVLWNQVCIEIIKFAFCGIQICVLHRKNQVFVNACELGRTR